MNRVIVFRAAARREYVDSVTWCERQRTGLGGQFEAAVERTLETISTFPDAFPIVHRDVRRAMIRRFPYGVFYRLRGEAIHVLAVMHGRRDPAGWKSRT